MGRKRHKPELLDLLAETERRKAAVAAAPRFLDLAFPSQRSLIEDPSRLKAALCTRRAGKSMGAGLALLLAAWSHPGTASLYLALTRTSAKEILWMPVLKKLDRDLGLGAVFNETDLTVSLPNGSIIFLKGADSDPGEAAKFLGKAYQLVVIDEAASFRQDLTSIVYSTLQPAMADLKGSILLIGTPSNLRRGLFYRVTTGQLLPTDAKWSVHRWAAADNPFMAAKIAAEMAEISQDRPLFQETPAYRQNYLGLWDVNTEALVYRFDPERNLYQTIPTANYRLILGVDLGFNDASAFVLTAYCEHDPVLYVLESFSKSGLDLTAVAEILQEYQRRYDIDTIVVDGANKQGVQELANRHQLALITADKRHKFDFIDLLNADFIQGKIKLHPEACKGLIDELENLVIDERAMARTGKRLENPACSNHNTDSLLYAWRHCYHYLATPAAATPKPGSLDWIQHQVDEMEAEAERRHRPKSDFDFPFPTE